MSTLLLTSLFVAETIAPTLESSVLVTSTSIHLVFVICKGLRLSCTRVFPLSETIAPDGLRLALTRLYVVAQAAILREVIVSHACSQHRTVDSGTPESHRGGLRPLVRLNHECFPSFITSLLPQSPHFTQDLSSFVCQGGVQLTST